MFRDIRQQAMAMARVIFAPSRFDGGRALEIVSQAIDLRAVQYSAERGHLAGGTAVFNDAADFIGFDPAQALRQQCRPGAASKSMSPTSG